MTRSAALLKALLARNEFPMAHLAHAFECTPAEVQSFASGEAIMPLSRQTRLADFVILNAPALARRGFALKAQVTAATSFHDGHTPVHREPPGRWSMRRRRI